MVLNIHLKVFMDLCAASNVTLEPNERFNVNPLSLNNAHFGELKTKRKQAKPITHDEEALLWLKKELGCLSARALQNTVYCNIFGLRNYDEHRDLKCFRFEKKVYEQCHVYLEYTDFGSKTNAFSSCWQKSRCQTFSHICAKELAMMEEKLVPQVK